MDAVSDAIVGDGVETDLALVLAGPRPRVGAFAADLVHHEGAFEGGAIHPGVLALAMHVASLPLQSRGV